MACPVKLFILFVFNFLLTLYGAVSANKTSPYQMDVTSHQDFPLHIKEDEKNTVTFTLRSYSGEVFKIMPVISDPDIATVGTNMTHTMDADSFNLTAVLKGIFLGRTSLKLYANTNVVNDPAMYDMVSKQKDELDLSDWYELPGEYEVTVSRIESAISHSFTGMVIVLVCLANVAMGCKTELSVVKEVLRRPVGPLTGMFSQFILMPLVCIQYTVLPLFSINNSVTLKRIVYSVIN